MSKIVKSKILFIGGVHSCGKSALLAAITKSSKFNKLTLWPRIKREELFTERQYQKIVSGNVKSSVIKRSLARRLRDSYDEYLKQRQAMDANKGLFLVSDRCPLDSLSYINASYNLGWISEDDYRTLEKKFYNLFGPPFSMGSGIYLEPPLSAVEKEFSKRLNSKGDRFWERKTDFLAGSYYTFSKIYRSYIARNHQGWIMIKTKDFSKRKNEAMDFIGKIINK